MMDDNREGYPSYWTGSKPKVSNLPAISDAILWRAGAANCEIMNDKVYVCMASKLPLVIPIHIKSGLVYNLIMMAFKEGLKVQYSRKYLSVPPEVPPVPEVQPEVRPKIQPGIPPNVNVPMAPARVQPNLPPVREDLLYERFRRMKAPEFEGPTDPIAADNWLIDIQVILDFMRLTEQEKVLCASFALKKDARHWWMTVQMCRDVTAMN
ncbi:hypothetical protein TIFTF001_001813 [Ficus carica]|uniref:Uncharacterized protein n=1 Tax=Ficus carica TaxID=3494 RepID=A0AA87Z393_FICCA|nr:hypothetical protein TIFTF001_001813 [Ficus carica]